ncbi:MAG: hypothetical protein WCT32_05370 [Patescibacteria group bacterium]|jgi:hypothetical protein
MSEQLGPIPAEEQMLQIEKEINRRMLEMREIIQKSPHGRASGHLYLSHPVIRRLDDEIADLKTKLEDLKSETA